LNFCNIRKFVIPDLPPEAVQAGFVPKPISNPYYGPFTLKPGPKDPNPNISPFEAVHLFIDNGLIKQFQLNALANNSAKQWGEDCSKEAFWKYFAAVLGHGLVEYPQERDAYVAEKSNIAGLYRNQFLCDLHTFEQWQHAKQIFVLPVGHLTNAFNRRTEALVTPTRYVTFLTFLFQTSF
jgi:hypothetical protein